MDKNSAMTLQNKIFLYKLFLGLKDQTKNVSFEFWTRSKFSLPAEGPGGVTTHPGFLGLHLFFYFSVRMKHIPSKPYVILTIRVQFG